MLILFIFYKVIDLHNKEGVPNDAIGNALRNKRLMNIVECEDANNNTPMSEAASELLNREASDK